METVEEEVLTEESHEPEEDQPIEEETNEAEEQEDEGEEEVYTFGEDSPPQEEDEEETTELPKKLRQEIRDRNNEIKRLKQELEAKSPKEVEVTLAPKPTLEDCDYDEDVYANKLDEYYKTKIEYDKQQSKKQEELADIQRSWNETLSNYAKQRDEISATDYVDSEAIVDESLNETQKGIILQASENSAKFVYALGKNSNKLKELSSIKDPIKFAFAAAKLESQMKVTKRKPKSKPEKTIAGSSSIVNSDAKLDRLRKEAEKTGDFSKVHAYKKSLKK